MEVKEAIEIIRTNPVAYPDPDAQGVWDEAIRMALSALWKQDGKFPVVTRKFYDQEDWTKTYHCPVCNTAFIHEDFGSGFYAGEKYDYCHYCGQKIDWSVT